jgi:hypothetical protein
MPLISTNSPPPNDAKSGFGVGGRGEALALDGAVDDLLGQVERQEVERQGRNDDDQQPYLIALGVLPSVAENILFHCARTSSPWMALPSPHTWASNPAARLYQQAGSAV